MSLERIAGGALIAAALGVGAAVLAPGLTRAARPRLLKALATGIALAREGRLAVEGAWEDFEDLLAEARAAADRAREAGEPAAASVTPFVRNAPKTDAESPPRGA
jgi:hypothetical protein